VSEPAIAAVVIPAYNEAATVRDVAQRALQQAALVIVVDDGSCDGTAQGLEGLGAVVLRNEGNQGKAASLRRGADEAMRLGATAIVTLDGDGQHCPEDIPALMRAWHAAPDSIVIGSRLHERGKIPPVRYWANRFANSCIGIVAGYPIADSQSGFRVYPARVFGEARLRYDRAHSFVFESEVLIEAVRLGIRAHCVPVQVIYSDRARASHFRPVVDIARIARMLIWRLLTQGLAQRAAALRRA
jgi:glycosyltransferase involved in cell wall biosynthesis